MDNCPICREHIASLCVFCREGERNKKTEEEGEENKEGEKVEGEEEEEIEIDCPICTGGLCFFLFLSRLSFSHTHFISV